MMRRKALRPLRVMGLIGLMGLMGLIGIMGLMGCGKATPEELASLAAEGYYRHLAAGECEQFLEGRAGVDSLPDGYREQLVAGCRQFVAQQQRDHRGIRSVAASNALMDTVSRQMNVFLILEYGDSTQEEIVVPMVEHNGRWRMK
jgi:hypothetical protein